MKSKKYFLEFNQKTFSVVLGIANLRQYHSATIKQEVQLTYRHS